MQKKRIFISTYYMEIGGVERSLIGLLHSLDYKKVTVDLFLHRHTGEFMSLIPKEVNLLPEDKYYATYSRPVKQLFKEGFIKIGVSRALAALRTKNEIKKKNLKENASSVTYSVLYTEPFLPSLEKYGNYDLAISFLMPHNIVLRKVKAKKKIGWIHTDYSTIYLNKEIEKPNWEPLDHIVSISKSVEKSFLSIFPELESKIIEIENILHPKIVKEQAKEKEVKPELQRNEDDAILFCSVGRISYAKNFDQIPFVCQKLVELGHNVKWYIIGDGGSTVEIEKNIQSCGMENHVFLLGKKANPYPYMQACDFYLQLSRYEGKAVTVREAQILGKKVIISDFATAKSQLEDGVDGIIVPMENIAAAEAIDEFIKDKEKQNAIVQALKEGNYGNEEEVEKIYELLDI